MNSWVYDNYIEIFGAIAGIIYIFLEVRQNIWLWPLGIVTSGIYVWIFFTGKLYADMSLQAYYVIISVLGWYWWLRGTGQGAGQKGEEVNGGRGEGESGRSKRSEDSAERKVEKMILEVSRLKMKTGMVLFIVFTILYSVMWIVLSRLTDSPVPGWDAFLTSLSIIATWMLARKIYEHWFLWIAVNTVSVVLYFTRGLYPTVVLYLVYTAMSFIGLKAWKRNI